MMTKRTPQARSMGGLTSPVKAPRASACMFCAATAMRSPAPRPASASTSAGRAGNGGARTTSTPAAPRTRGTIAPA